MLFNSWEFLFFFPLVTLVYFSVPHAQRWFWLLVASCVFYMAFIPHYVLILFVVIGIDYLAGILIEQATGKRRKGLLIISLIANIGILAVFKYYNFFNENVEVLLGSVGIAYNADAYGLDFILPIGLSFHTFQSMSYTIEVYRGNFKAERHLGIYALYVMYYPQLVAGPIERPQNILPQLHTPQTIDYNRISSGLRLMAWGLFKKVVIADRLALYVDQVYDHPGMYMGAPVLLATYFFAIQIYCDFSGYSDIALGASRVMGITLMRNFNRPYFSTSIREFWSRWHISLSTWFRDYLYIPLGGNRVGKSRWMLNLFIVFMISGLWHGASWNYVVWGALHGGYLVAGILLVPLWNLLGWQNEKPLEKLGWQRLLRMLLVFHIVCLAWVFFRARTLGDALMILNQITLWETGKLGINILPDNLLDLLLGLFLIGWLFLIQFFQLRFQLTERFLQWPTVGRWVVYAAWLGAIIWLGKFSQTQFIYFQF
jgi:D-alanyl-lipoteichoic acid acyltransferase DltB (MBOAT superfamily)